MAANDAQRRKLEDFVTEFDISIATPDDLVVLQDYEIVIIVDDSGSMQWPANLQEQEQMGLPLISHITSQEQVIESFKKMQDMKRKGVGFQSRWDELQETLATITELGSIFDRSGVDIYFLNRPDISKVSSSSSGQFKKAFQKPPEGSTPLTETLQRVVDQAGHVRPVLLFIMTDGEPDGGKDAFRQVLRGVVEKRTTPHTFCIQIMACTGEEEAVSYLDEIDKEFSSVDVTDDYYAERAQVMKTRDKFSRSDWCLKAMLGPVSRKFDAMDEAQAYQASRPLVARTDSSAVGGGANPCGCVTGQPDGCAVS